MNSKQTILGKIRQLGLEKKPLPEIPSFEHPVDLLEQYKKSCAENKGIWFETSVNALPAYITAQFPGTQQICSLSSFVQGSVDVLALTQPHDLALIDVAVVHAAFAVAENGALWIPGTGLVHTVLPFITQHLIVILNKEDVVATMHEAYSRIEFSTDFGVFIAGPSKTADIEQALVIGAHGPISHHVLLV